MVASVEGSQSLEKGKIYKGERPSNYRRKVCRGRADVAYIESEEKYIENHDYCFKEEFGERKQP